MKLPITLGRYRLTHCAFQRVPEDLWVGVFYRETFSNMAHRERYWNVWICLVPCRPLKLTIELLREGRS